MTEEIDLETEILYIDSREPEVMRQGLLNGMVERRLGVVRIRTLPVCDYMLFDGEKVIGIERKSWSDFINSITDGRLFEQGAHIGDMLGDGISILLLEGDQKAALEQAGIYRQSVSGAQASVGRFFDLTVNTTDMDDSIDVILHLFKRFTSKRKGNATISRHRKGYTIQEQRLIFLESLPGIGGSLANRILDHFSGDLEGAVYGLLGSNVIFTSGNNPKDIQGPMKGIEGLGPKKLMEIQKLIKKNGGR